MTLSMYQASIPVFLRTLGSLSLFLDKGAAEAAERKIDPAALLATRLFPNMFPLLRQVQLSADFGKGTGARLAGVEVPKYEDNETSFEELKARIARTSEYLKSLKPAQIDGSEDRAITLTIGGQAVGFKGQPYLLHFALPNFFFHVTTAHAILRHNGVPIGKMDYLGGR
jgi:hypothetical protein